MRVIYLKKDNNEQIKDEITLTIGNFDGVHLGHKSLLDKVMSYKDTKHAALTFSPHPKQLFLGDKFKTIFTIEGKISLFEQSGFDYLFIANFNKEFASLSIDEFIKFLKSLNVKRLVLGNDFRFGSKASGSVKDLKDDFDLVVVDTIKSLETERVSTTLIKNKISSGEIIEANNLLGYKYHIYGVIEHGNKVGRTLGFPTANISFENIILPKTGVYFVTITIDNITHVGIANIGYNPTINESKTEKLEVYILDFDEEIYDKHVLVTFYERIRDEKKFASKEELILKMQEDKKHAKKLIKKYNL